MSGIRCMTKETIDYSFETYIKKDNEEEQIGDYINGRKKFKQQTTSPLNWILYGNNKEIQETVRNLLVGKMIYTLLEQEEFKEIKQRTINGRFSSMDQKKVIGQLQVFFTDEENCKAFDEAVEWHFVLARISLPLMGKHSFGELLKYNTNISAKSIFAAKKLNIKVKELKNKLSKRVG